MKSKLAVFDIDGTIFRSSLIIELVNALVAKHIFPKTADKEIEEDYLAWVDRKGSYDKYITKVVEVFKKYIKDCSSEEVRKVTVELINHQKDRTYLYTRNLIKKLKNENYFLYAISGSPEVLVAEFSKTMGFDDYLGNQYEIKNNKYTGLQPTDIFKDKAKVLKAFLNVNKNFNPKNTIGVGDSEGDISFLELVGNPIAFNPAKGLAEHAEQKGWKIVVERKNVVFEILKSKLLEIES